MSLIQTYQAIPTGSDIQPTPPRARHSLDNRVQARSSNEISGHSNVVFLKPSLRKPYQRSLSVGKSARIKEVVEQIPVESYKQYNWKNNFKGKKDKCCLLF